jgi:hypothetical protein
MTSRRDVTFFLINLESMDVLLPAGDFKAAASFPNTADSGFLRFEDNLARLSPGISRVERNPSSSLFFFRDRPGKTASGPAPACIVDRTFELKEYPFKDIRPVPACLKAALSKEGIIAVRFGTGGKIQIILDLRQANGGIA